LRPQAALGSSSCLIAAASLGHATLHAIRPACDKGFYVDFDVCALTAAAFCTGTVLLDMALGHIPTYMQIGRMEN
jgi:hypothetical protein